MTHLNIQQGSNVEIVSALIIKKLYDTALTVSEPLEGETDAAYMSGHISVPHAFEKLVYYLAGTIREGTNGVVTSQISNPSGRFLDLTIDVTSGCYIDFEDPVVELLLISGGYSSDNVGVTESDAANATFTNPSPFYQNTDITSFPEFKYFTKANTNPPSDLFSGCTNLVSIDLSNVTKISVREFQNSGITTVNAPLLQEFSSGDWISSFNNSAVVNVINLGSVTSIPNGTFLNCTDLETAVLPTTVTSLGKSAFSGFGTSGTTFTTISGTENITTIGQNAFSGQEALVLNSSLFPNLVSVDSYAFLSCYKFTGELYLPKLQSTSVETFSNTGISKIKCLGKLTNVSRQCFSKSKNDLKPILTEVYLPYECTTLDNRAFYNNTGLTTVKLYSSSVDDWVEGQTPQYTNISRITSFGDRCFEGCSLLSLTPQDIQNATTIGNNAFRGVSLLSGTLNLPNLTGTLGSASFYNTGISSVSNLGSVTEIGNNAFANTNISSITIPNSVKKCSCSIINNTPVQEIIFPEGVEEITDGLFLTKNNSLNYIEIPSTVTDMHVFFHRTLENSLDNLCTLVIKAAIPPTLNYYNGTEIDSTKGEKFAGIYVPDASLTAYQSAANAWQHSSIQAKLKPISQLQTDNPTAWAKYNRV